MGDLSKVPTEFCENVWGLRDALYRKALSLTKSHADADDLVADSVLKAFRAWETFRVGTSYQAWLFTILMNTFLNDYHKRRRQAERIAKFAKEPRPEPADETPLGPELLEAIEELPAEYMAVFQLVCVHEMSQREAADALGIPLGTAQSRVFRARAKLRESLSGYAAAEWGIGLL